MIYREETTVTITKGPSKMDLATAWAYAYDKVRGPFPVAFYLMDNKTGLPLKAKANPRYPRCPHAGTPVSATITKLEHEDGSGEKFLLKGHLDIYPTFNKEPDYSVPFEGFYEIKEHTGWMKFSLSYGDNK